MILRWEWRPVWVWDPFDGWYQHDFDKLLMYSMDGTTWSEVEVLPYPITDEAREELRRKYPAPQHAPKDRR